MKILDKVSYDMEMARTARERCERYREALYSVGAVRYDKDIVDGGDQSDLSDKVARLIELEQKADEAKKRLEDDAAVLNGHRFLFTAREWAFVIQYQLLGRPFEMVLRDCGVHRDQGLRDLASGRRKAAKIMC